MDWHMSNSCHVSLWFVTYICLKCWISLTLVIAWMCHVSLANVSVSGFRILALRGSLWWESMTFPSLGNWNLDMMCLLLEFHRFAFRHFGTLDVESLWLLHLPVSKIPVSITSSNAPVSGFQDFTFWHFGTPDDESPWHLYLPVAEILVFNILSDALCFSGFRISWLRDSCSGSSWHLQLPVFENSESLKWSLTKTLILLFDHHCTVGLPCLLVFHQMNKHTFAYSHLIKPVLHCLPKRLLVPTWHILPVLNSLSLLYLPSMTSIYCL